MADRGNRGGPPALATVAVAGVINTSAQEYEFRQSDGVRTYARIVYVTNMDDATGIYVLVNETGATPTKFLHFIPAGGTKELTDVGRLNVGQVSVFAPTGVADFATGVRVIGWG